MKLDSSGLTRIIEAARGKRPADLCIKGGRLVNVFAGQVETADIAVQDGIIVGWGNYEAREEIAADGMYVCPGFIDGHIHMESSLLSPTQFCAAVIPWGTSAVMADPHEIANVLGLAGIRFFLEATEGVPLDVYFRLPSCVPATPLETAGAQLRALDLYSMLPHDRLTGIAEMMNFPGVLEAFPDVIDKLLLFQDGRIDGHSPGLSGLALNAYLSGGITSDHECTTLEEAREKVSKGMRIMLREGSQSKDLATLLPVVDDYTWPNCMFVCDDSHPDDLVKKGHMNVLVNRAMELGMEPVRALTLATWTPAMHFGLHRHGAIAPGRYADFSLSPTLNPWNPQRVFKRGVEAARDGKLLIDPALWPRPFFPPSPMEITRLDAGDLEVAAQPGLLRTIGVGEGTLITRKLLLAPKIAGGLVVPDPERDILKLAVYNRYVPDKPPAVAFVQGIGIRKGAIATTVAHDSHNLIVAGASDADILHVAEAVRGVRGGLAIGVAGEEVEMLPLPIAGLMSDHPVHAVARRLEALNEKARAFGCGLHNPFMALSFLALPVIPELKLTDLGLVDVSIFAFVSLFEPG